MTGKPHEPGPVPLSLAVRNVAKGWGIPPWAVMSGSEPSDDDRRRWLIREFYFRRTGH